MTPRAHLPLIAGLAILLLALPAAATDPTPYIERMMAVYEHPFDMGFSMSMNMTQGGMTMAMNGKGDMTWADTTHSLMSMALDVTMPGTEQAMAMNMKTVSDGEVVWTEIDNPMGKQVMKMEIEALKSAAANQGLDMSFGQNPLEQMRAMQAFFDFQVVEETGETVTLTGSLRDDAPPALAQAGALTEQMLLTLNRETGVLVHMTLGPADTPFLSMTVDRFERLNPDDVPASRFHYTPPEGANVISPLETANAGQ